MNLFSLDYSEADGTDKFYVFFICKKEILQLRNQALLTIARYLIWFDLLFFIIFYPIILSRKIPKRTFFVKNIDINNSYHKSKLGILHGSK